MGKNQRRDKIARLISWGHWFTFANIILCLLIGIIYIDSTPSPTTFISTVYLIVNWIGHFAFLPFVFFIILIFPFCLLIPYSKVLRSIAALISSLGIVALIFDALFFRHYGYHLNAYSLAQMAKDAEAAFTGASFVIILMIMLGFLILLGFELLLANYTWKHLSELQHRRLGAPATTVFVLCFFASHSIHVWADAELYDPITQQDDTFPLSYPTTAKTLMSKHGFIEVENYQAQQQKLMSAENIRLRYPHNTLLCSKTSQTQGITLVVFDRLNAEQSQRVGEVANDNDLTQVDIQLLAHPSREGGLFQLLYGLPDFYQETIENQNISPAYLKPLADFGIDVSWHTSPNWPQELGLTQFKTDWNAEPLSSFYPRNENQVNVVLLSHEDINRLPAILGSLGQQRVLLSSLAPSNTEGLLGQQQFKPENMRVTLWEKDFALPQQSIGGLMDLMPTALSRVMSCAGGTQSFSNGEDLMNGGERWPLVETYSPYIVIYDQELITVLDNNGQYNIYRRDDFSRLDGAEPTVPVLIDALKDLKRFSGRARD